MKPIQSKETEILQIFNDPSKYSNSKKNSFEYPNIMSQSTILLNEKPKKLSP